MAGRSDANGCAKLLLARRSNPTYLTINSPSTSIAAAPWLRGMGGCARAESGRGRMPLSLSRGDRWPVESAFSLAAPLLLWRRRRRRRRRRHACLHFCRRIIMVTVGKEGACAPVSRCFVVRRRPSVRPVSRRPWNIVNNRYQKRGGGIDALRQNVQRSSMKEGRRE